MGRVKDFLMEMEEKMSEAEEKEAMDELYQHLLDIGSEETLRYYQPTAEEIDDMASSVDESIDDVFEEVEDLLKEEPVEFIEVELVDGETSIVDSKSLKEIKELPFNPLY